MASVIDSRTPLEPTSLPTQFVGREATQDVLTQTFGVETEARLQHLHVHGPRGTGKTHLLRCFLTTFPPTVTTFYLSGIEHNTEYKALERLYQLLTGTKLGTGHRAADLQRQIHEQVTLPTVIVLDEIDFLLLNDGDDLLYFLTRLENTAVVTISANRSTFEDVLDARTYSSFRPQQLALDAYTPDEARQILADRARRALQPQSVHRDALRTIADTTQNIAIGLLWLREAAEAAEDHITPDLVEEVQATAYHKYVLYMLDSFTPQHRRLYDAIDRLDKAFDAPFTSGTVFQEYRDHCEAADVTPLSERRIGDFLTHLELLDLIDVAYHYGGAKGKTREIRLADWTAGPDSEEVS